MDGHDEPRAGTGKGLSRRGLLKRAGIVGVAATGVGVAARTSPAEIVEVKTSDLESATIITAAEAETIDAMVARIIPTDANGPGGAEARAGRYIAWSLSGGLAFFREAYEQGIASLDTYCRGVYGRRFVELSAAQQDAVLTNLQNNTATGFSGSQTFFNLVRGHAVEGMFGDPFHGGNANLVGWDLIGYPGIKVSAVTARDQAIDVTVPRTGKSAWDYNVFRKLKTRDPSRQGRTTSGSGSKQQQTTKGHKHGH
jgi:gluconate 2-dehydrogenase gamma chain